MLALYFKFGWLISRKAGRAPSTLCSPRHAWLNPAFIALFALLLSSCAGFNPDVLERENAVRRPGKIALFPFENLSGDKDVLMRVMPLLQSSLAGKGMEVIGEDSIRGFLQKERIRERGSVSLDIARRLGLELGVQAIVTGCVVSYSTKHNPQFGVTARLIDASSGRILWADYASATGDDFITLLGLGRINTAEELIPVVLNRLIRSFDAAPPPQQREQTYRIAVFPFKNRSKTGKAGIIAANLFITELVKDPWFVPVEYGDVRKFMVDKRIRNRGELDYKSMEEASKALGAELILLGTVESFSDDAEAGVPEVILNARIVDVQNKKILWYDSIQVNGDDEITIFERGKMRSVDKTAHSAVAKLIKHMEITKWH